MAEVLFYHLTEKTLEQALPGLLEKCLERQWRVVVQGTLHERLQALDAHLWTYSEEGFLPHGMARDGTEAAQPVWLTMEEDNPNSANVRFLIDGATPPDLSPYQRGVYLFDGHDESALSHARERWKIEKAAGHAVTYWRQNARGGWERQG
jgi:DNA polymerase III subunit chi